MIARKGSNCLPEIRHAISLLKPQALSDTTLGLTIRGFICLLTIFPFRTFVSLQVAFMFHGTKIDGCFFHFCQALMRHVNDLGLKKRYERFHVNINGIRTYSWTRIRRLMILAFVHPEDVITAFHTVLDAIPEDLDIDAFLNYFQATWIEGMSTVRRNGRAMYPPAVWNIHSRTLQMMNRTNNHLEAFHNAFKQKVGHSNPTIWGFITGMRLQQAASDNIMAAIEVGDKPPRRNARDTKKSDRLLYVTSQYSTKPLFEFLDLIADI